MTVLVPHDEGMRALADIDGLELVRYDEQAEDLPDAAAHAQVLVPGFLATSDALHLVERCPSLNLVQLLSAGAEMWVGRLPEGVRLSDCQGAHGGVTAEWVLAAILAVLREVPVFVRAQDEERWDQHVTDTLTGKRVLLVGAGDLADQTARRLDPFDVASVTRVGRRARDGVHATSELPELLGEADVVVLLVPLTDETRGLVDADFLAAMPDGALLVNAARGPVVDTDALLAELSVPAAARRRRRRRPRAAARRPPAVAGAEPADHPPRRRQRPGSPRARLPRGAHPARGRRARRGPAQPRRRRLLTEDRLQEAGEAALDVVAAGAHGAGATVDDGAGQAGLAQRAEVVRDGRGRDAEGLAPRAALQSNGSGPRYIALMIARRAGSTSAVRTVVMSSSSTGGSGRVRAMDRPSRGERL